MADEVCCLHSDSDSFVKKDLLPFTEKTFTTAVSKIEIWQLLPTQEGKFANHFLSVAGSARSRCESVINH